jgi:hypothetical protein
MVFYNEILSHYFGFRSSLVFVFAVGAFTILPLEESLP